jgi:hypothetical protein
MAKIRRYYFLPCGIPTGFGTRLLNLTIINKTECSQHTKPGLTPTCRGLALKAG